MLVAVIPLDAQAYPDVEKRGTSVASVEHIQGDWTCAMTSRIIAQEVVPSDKHLNNVRIKGDTILYFEYPCRYYGTRLFNTDSIMNTQPLLKNIKFLGDTLVMFSSGYRFYVRDTFNQKIVDALVQDTFYLPSIFGKWYLQTQNCMDHSGEPPWRVKYPVYLPSIYKLDRSDVVNKNTLLININGTLRKFKIVDCSIKEGYIELESERWHTSSFRVVYFNRFPTHDRCGNVIIYR